MKIGRCGRCRHGIKAYDGGSDANYTVCALMPPTTNDGGKTWNRPPMAMLGWCGQFKLGWLRLFGYGPRA